MAHISVLEYLDGGEIQPAWLEYRDGWEFLVSPVTAEERQSGLRAKPGKDRASDEQSRRFWCGRVTDWRGANVKGKAFPFTEARIRELWRIDSAWRDWLVEESMKLDNFPRGAGADAPGSASGNPAGE